MRLWFIICGCLWISASNVAALDQIRRKGAEKPLNGEITAVTQTEVVIKGQSGGKEDRVPANEIESITWDSPTAAVAKAKATDRGLKTGDFDRVIEAWEEAIREMPSTREPVRLDSEFGLARALYMKALANRETVPKALTKLKEFAKKDHYRSYEGLVMLGDLALSTGDTATAESTYASLGKAPWLEMQMAGKIGGGRSLLLKKDTAGAKKLFDDAVAMPVKSSLEKSRQLEAMVGQARCQLELKQPKEALAVLEKVILDAGEDDSRTQAEAYLRQGDCQTALGTDQKKVLRSYLHVDVIPEFAEHRTLHAEALYRISQLFTAVGEKERGADAASRLKDNYPDSEWAKMAPAAKEESN